jgi:hypothetical protein
LFSKCSDANECWSVFSDILNYGIAQFVPLMQIGNSGRKPLKSSKVIRKLAASKRKFWNLKKVRPSIRNTCKYKKSALKLKEALLKDTLSKESHSV